MTAHKVQWPHQAAFATQTGSQNEDIWQAQYGLLALGENTEVMNFHGNFL